MGYPEYFFLACLAYFTFGTLFALALAFQDRDCRSEDKFPHSLGEAIFVIAFWPLYILFLLIILIACGIGYINALAQRNQPQPKPIELPLVTKELWDEFTTPDEPPPPHEPSAVERLQLATQQRQKKRAQMKTSRTCPNSFCKWESKPEASFCENCGREF